MNHSLADTIRQTRKAQHLTQKEVAQDICAQSMLSAIENNKYIPNADIIIRLCRRLQISLDQISLADNYQITAIKTLNSQLEKLCNQHQYQDLYRLLNNAATKNLVNNATQLQAYYYYLGIAQWQIKETTTEVITSFELSLAQAPKRKSNTLKRLTWAALAVVYATKQDTKQAQQLINQSLQQITMVSYEENQNILYYLAAQVYYRIHNFSEALTYLRQGISFASHNNSHYLLANFYYLSAQIAQEIGQPQLQTQSQQYQELLSSLFQEKIYRE